MHRRRPTDYTRLCSDLNFRISKGKASGPKKAVSVGFVVGGRERGRTNEDFLAVRIALLAISSAAYAPAVTTRELAYGPDPMQLRAGLQVRWGRRGSDACRRVLSWWRAGDSTRMALAWESAGKARAFSTPALVRWGSEHQAPFADSEFLQKLAVRGAAGLPLGEPLSDGICSETSERLWATKSAKAGVCSKLNVGAPPTRITECNCRQSAAPLGTTRQTDHLHPGRRARS